MEKQSDTVVPVNEPTDTANHTGKKKSTEQELNIQSFWASVMSSMQEITHVDPSSQSLPLARIRRIMKLDEKVNMIGAEAPLIFAKAIEIFIHELTLRAFMITEKKALKRDCQELPTNVARSPSPEKSLSNLTDIEVTVIDESNPAETSTVGQLVSTNQPVQHMIQHFSHLPTSTVGHLESTNQPVQNLIQHVLIPSGKITQTVVTENNPADYQTSTVGQLESTIQPVQHMIQHILTPSGEITQTVVTESNPGDYQTSTVGHLESTNQPVQHMIQHVLTPSGEIAQISIPQNQMNFFSAAAGCCATQPFFIQAAPTILTSAGMFLSANQLQQQQP
ncbi:AGAP000441-PA-like protein [Anopheles sinensis]|uniref:AGAP000441-PA-like protein n=1 Tax=Anopheles sinensis TaxID=74873 RepID=A0A084VAH4_ANOSI|nr:AGAP000441-PA-like protein [Anopheles sinensis]